MIHMAFLFGMNKSPQILPLQPTREMYSDPNKNLYGQMEALKGIPRLGIKYKLVKPVHHRGPLCAWTL